jgi:hypothetical protein
VFIKVFNRKVSICLCIGFVVVVILSLFFGVVNLYNQIIRLEEYNKDLVVTAQEDLKDIVVLQSKLRAKEFTDTFAVYSEIEKPQWFKKYEGFYVFHSIDKTEDYLFDPDSMELRSGFNKTYNIVDKATGEVLHKNVSPEWDRSVLNKFLNISVRNTRLFGVEGDPIIIDQVTKEILIDDSYNCADVPEVMGNDRRRYMSLDWKHPNNMNPEASKWVIDNVINWDNDKIWFYFFTAPGITEGDLVKGKAFNFEEFPMTLSTIEGREVGYTVVVEIKNEYGMVLQLRVMFGAQEYEFTQSFTDTYKAFILFSDTLANNKTFVILIPTVALLIIVVLLIIIAVLYFKRGHIHISNKNTEELYELLEKKIIAIDKKYKL